MNRELIIYASPTGQLAEACADYFERAASIGQTTAQTYPPHCTLTGFFRRSDPRCDEVASVVATRIDNTGHPPAGAVRIGALGHHQAWLGLELNSTWLLEWTASTVDLLPACGQEDPLRPKSWLHLSLAYGVADLDPYLRLADELSNGLVGPDDGGRWRLGLWERTGAAWVELTA